MNIKIIVPYRMYNISSVDFNDLCDKNVYNFTKSECEGFFTVDNLENYNNRSFREIHKDAHFSDLIQIRYDDSLDFFLQFNITCTVDKTSEIKNDELSHTVMNETRKEILLASLIEEVHKYLFLLSIKTNNSISILKGFYVKKKMLKAQTKEILIGWDYEKYKNKFEQEMNLFRSWEYINRKTLFIDGLSQTNVARAISFLSLILFEKNSEISNMVLTLTAIEALYARGNAGISSQLTDKIGLYLGKHFVNTKEINQLYNTRSRYIHGDIDINLSFCMHDVYRLKEINLYNARSYGRAILFETIKKLINEDKYELDFNYCVK